MADGDGTSGDNSPVINGTVHGDVSVYYADPDASPETKYAVALSRLDAGMPRYAEDLLAEVLRTPLGNKPRVMYHYLVAAFSDRTRGDLLDRHEQALAAARRAISGPVAAQDSDDSVRLGHLVRLVDLAGTAAAGTEPFTDADSAAMETAYNQLPLDHRRHLDDLLAGPAKNRAFDTYIGKIRERRNADLVHRRPDNAWKFFEPDPAEPKDLRRPLPGLSRLAQTLLAAGTLLFLVGLVLVATQIIGRSNSDALLAASPTAVAGLAAGLSAAWWRSRNRQLLEHCRQRTRGQAPGTAATADEDVAPALRMVNAFYRRVGPSGNTSWDAMTAGLRVTLAREIVAEYDENDVEYGRLRWLAHWHALQTLEQWQNHELLAYDKTYRERGYLRRIEQAGVVLLVFTALILLGGLLPLGSATALLPFAATAGGLVLLWRPLANRAGLISAHRIQTQWQSSRLNGERVRWAWWTARLKGRPTDQEMASWLADDIDVYKADVMKERRILPSSVICTVELATGTEEAARARDAYGPIRYSDYILHLFLLTRTGLRLFQTNLDFYHGNLYDEAWRAVPYGALREVQVEQVSVRRARHNPGGNQGTRGHTITPEQGSLTVVDIPQPTSDLQVLHRKFVVRLDSGGTFEIELGNFEELRAGTEPADLVARLALEATGVDVAQHVLETVVVDGTDWISREERRRRQPVMESAGAPPALDRPVDDAGEPEPPAAA